MGLLSIVIALVSILLMGVILIQNPKGGGVDATFGGSAANQMLGASKSTDFIEKLTWYLAAALVVLCIMSAVMISGGSVGGPDTLPLNEVPQ